MTTAAVRFFPTPEAIGEFVATAILQHIDQAATDGRRFLLGAPTGRTPRPIFADMARQLAARPRFMRHVTFVMMDEYLVEGAKGLEYAPSDAPWSCHHFGEMEILAPLNAALAPEQQMPADALWFPSPHDPAEYEGRIAAAGGIDFFLLASGAGDGHVAFNPPGSPRDSRTRIIPLSEQTRRDNLQTFPAFGTLDTVPHHGVSVGVATITEAREAMMVVWGSGKRLTHSRIVKATGYEPDWPATMIHECAVATIVADAAAAAPAPVAAA
jgi:glucosamine-6-phosphate deaminase